MNDKELLEMAAKAARLKHVDYTGIDYNGCDGIVLVDGVGRHLQSWNPLTSDADAFRLMVQLGLTLQVCCYDDYDRDYVGVWKYTPESFEVVSIRELGDRSAATRRAIVRAAAEIGRMM